MARPASSVYSRPSPFAVDAATSTSTGNNDNDGTLAAAPSDSTVTSIGGLLRTAEDDTDRTLVHKIDIDRIKKRKKPEKRTDVLNAVILFLALVLAVLLVLSCVISLGGFNRASLASPASTGVTPSSGIKISPGMPDEPTVTASTATSTGTATATGTSTGGKEDLSALVPFLTFAGGKTTATTS
ncbi:hypothetical protein MGYG_02547 [Nannizzia gypsea CBS 118893]|uniref:Transmembrane protein n=1 Tax=Arthroderma gypseum (strain ATCC MYA-4604 / CBS 118893) TaxID=535722 RepID=E4UN74_ARTGP|nr:hypothetical protein MGYG_02547 [Nannizzia gypsea CBS 118893]EFQ99535.1 hypothetical protein MGYG_02547 [Nannizzia gypsea CBS 118893]